MNEEKLIESLACNELTALDSIIKKYAPYVCTVARNFSRGTLTNEDIDDISVEVFYNLWVYRQKLNIRVGLSAYLSAMTRNAVKKRFKKGIPLQEDISELDIPSDSYVEDIAEINEMMICLNDGLRELPKEERDIFLRFYLYGEKSSDIAEMTGMAENTVRTKLRRTRLKLKKYMTERGFDNV